MVNEGFDSTSRWRRKSFHFHCKSHNPLEKTNSNVACPSTTDTYGNVESHGLQSTQTTGSYVGFSNFQWIDSGKKQIPYVWSSAQWHHKQVQSQSYVHHGKSHRRWKTLPLLVYSSNKLNQIIWHVTPKIKLHCHSIITIKLFNYFFELKV